MPVKTSGGLYSVHPGVAMVQKWMKELPEKTGRSVEEWIALVQKSGPPTENERREWLKKNTSWARTRPGGSPNAPMAKAP